MQFRIVLAVAFFAILHAAIPAGAIANPREAQVSSGQLITVENFASRYLPARDVQIWLPDGYTEAKKYAVLYMHDGQMLFDNRVTWNKQEWGVDEAAGALMQSGTVRDFIVVGIANGDGRRHREYFPEAVFHSLPEAKQKSFYEADSPDMLADEYLQFLVTELKPYIDRTYSVHTDQANTVVMGSSMGGLISMYAISEYPDVFGAAACVSTHWPGIDPAAMEMIPAAFLVYMREHLPRPGTHRIYFDYGNETLDAFYPPLQAKVDTLMQDLGYSAPDWVTVFEDGANHSEDAWRGRLPSILTFLFGKG